MILVKRYFLLFLFAFFLCWCAGALSEDIRSAKVMITERVIPSDRRTDYAAFSPPPSRGTVSLEHRQLNDRLSKGKFLVASRRIRDPRFMETVILLIHHDSNGTVGLIVNRPTTVKLSDFFPDIADPHGREHYAFIGGPVGMNQVLLLMQLRKQPEESQRIFGDVYVSSSKTVLESLIKNPAREVIFRAYAGYAGWGSGQLEQELLKGDWHVARADTATIFKKPSPEIWQDLIREAEIIRIEL